MPLVECRLSKVVMSESHDRQVIMLQEVGGKRRFPIVIGFFEVFAIHRFVNNEVPPRPLTHELIGSILEALNVRIDRVIINDLRDNTFYARLMLQIDGRALEVDSRPSDAIALASQSHAPIFVEEHVLAGAAQDVE